MPSSSENPFLQDSWNNLAEETNEPLLNKDTVAIETYLLIKAETDKNPHLSKILKQVEDAAIRYAKLVTGFTRTKMDFREGSVTKEDIKAYDETRRLTHNRLIDEVNLLSREFKKAGLDNSWRNVVGLDRDEVGFWARKVAELFIDEDAKEGGDGR